MVLEGLIGVATGLLGNAITSFTNLKTQKLKNEHDIAMVRAETKAMQAEAEMNVKITETQVAGELAMIEEKNYGDVLRKAMEPSLNSGIMVKLFDSPWTAWIGSILAFLLGVVDVVKGMMRPGLTLYLVALTSYLTYYAKTVLETKEELMSVASAELLFGNITEIVIYLTVSCVTWWFADRRTAKFAMRLNDGNAKK